MNIEPQREKYLAQLREGVMPFWNKVVEQYNQGISPKKIAKMHTNPKTGKPYSRQHIHLIIKKMREL